MLNRVLGISAVAMLGYLGYIQHEQINAMNQRVNNVEDSVSHMKDDIGIIKEIMLEKQATSVKYSEKEIDCMTRNIYYEAGVEDRMGKYAVAQVTLNRVKTGKWGKSICSVVYAKKQFSWTAKKKRAWSHPKGKTWDESKLIAHKVLAEGIRVRPLKKSLFYYAEYIDTPKWVDDTKFCRQIGQHLFYTQAKGSSIKV